MDALTLLEAAVAPRATRSGNGHLRKPAGLLPATKEWLRDQSINVVRHTAALRPFKRAEFGTDAASPTEGQIRATNALIVKLRRRLLHLSRRVAGAAQRAIESPTHENLEALLRSKEFAHRRVQMIETIWSFYLEIFGQRITRFAEWLEVCDRIALDCYQVAYTGLGKARPVPAPPPFSHMATGRTPATYRRGVPLRRLARQLNPFPLIQLPYHRLVNPWTLGAILHEVSHNLQNDLGLARVVPEGIFAALVRAGLGEAVASVWRRWNRETFADLSGLLLGGPAVVDSLLDVVGRAPEMVLSYNPRGVHPTPYLRAFISLELLRRLGFVREAEGHRRLWMRMYPHPELGAIPRTLLEAGDAACKLVVDVICYRPYPSLGGKRLAEVIPFGAKDQSMIREAAARLAAGTPTGVLPERFLVGAARVALDRKLARPGRIAEGFYRSLRGG